MRPCPIREGPHRPIERDGRHRAHRADGRGPCGAPGPMRASTGSSTGGMRRCWTCFQWPTRSSPFSRAWETVAVVRAASRDRLRRRDRRAGPAQVRGAGAAGRGPADHRVRARGAARAGGRAFLYGDRRAAGRPITSRARTCSCCARWASTTRGSRFRCAAVQSEVADDVQQATGPRYGVINPGAGWPNKQWPPEKFGAVAAAIQKSRGLPWVAVWGPGEESLARRVEEASSGSTMLAPPTSLADLMAIVQRAAIVVAGDTGPVHLAAAAGTPVVGLYGPTNPARNGPWSPEDVCISRFDRCRCHHKRRCTAAAWCLDTIGVDEVVDAVERRLTSSKLQSRQMLRQFLARRRVALGLRIWRRGRVPGAADVALARHRRRRGADWPGDAAVGRRSPREEPGGHHVGSLPVHPPSAVRRLVDHGAWRRRRLSIGRSWPCWSASTWRRPSRPPFGARKPSSASDSAMPTTRTPSRAGRAWPAVSAGIARGATRNIGR